MVSKSTKFSTCTYIVKTCKHLYFLRKSHVYAADGTQEQRVWITLNVQWLIGTDTIPSMQYRGRIIKEGSLFQP